LPGLPVVSGTEAVRAFEALGYERVRQSGSHVRLVAEGRQPLTVPLHRELKRGTLRALIRDAGLGVEEFVQLRNE
jgi:predicted RNA binding protein YcfA (HicA-like mRNA interferase family)